MDPSLLQTFRRQLATWLEASLVARRLPFQRLELRPGVLTERGHLVPDMLLWINRDSQLAGSMILLPDIADQRLLADGAALARALGLGHFTTWEPREVTIWKLDSGTTTRQYSCPLPPAHRVTPDDFQGIIDKLLEELKIITVTSTPGTAEFPAHYFANLCLRTLQELVPGLTASARMAAGQTAANEWLERAPRSKAWLSLWRILLLLWRGRLPAGLQPERLEMGIRYILSDLTGGQLAWLDLRDDEAPLPEGDAVRLHRLAGRLRQLGWPRNDQQARELVNLLLQEAGRLFHLDSPRLPWCTERVELWVATQPPSTVVDCSVIAPRAYLAGWVLKSAMEGLEIDRPHGESLQSLDVTRDPASVVAGLGETRPLERTARDARLLLLRRAWPGRRFELPGSAPAWLWDALYVAGLTAEELSLVLPHDWYRAPGIMSLWAILLEHFQLAAISDRKTGEQALYLVRGTPRSATVKVHRQGQVIDVDRELLAGQPPGMTQVWLKGADQIVELLRIRALAGIGPAWPDAAEPLNRGLNLFLHTRIGSYLWTLCSGGQPPPELAATAGTIRALGVPVPNPTILTDLGLVGFPGGQAVPDPELLEKEFASIFGPVPELPDTPLAVSAEKPEQRRRNSISAEQVAAKVFADGIPRFPEHYLMRLYRPELAHYDFCGPLEITAEFFDRVTLRAIGREQTLEVAGSILADALVLASYSGAAGVDLPVDERLLGELTGTYRSDLQRLWDDLIRECRRREPHLQKALKQARKIWRQRGLPPEKVLRGR
jgi:hypothetical protein